MYTYIYMYIHIVFYILHNVVGLQIDAKSAGLANRCAACLLKLAKALKGREQVREASRALAERLADVEVRPHLFL